MHILGLNVFHYSFFACINQTFCLKSIKYNSSQLVKNLNQETNWIRRNLLGLKMLNTIHGIHTKKTLIEKEPRNSIKVET